MSETKQLSTENMHPEFADWLRPASLGDDRETYARRWKATARLVGTVTEDLERDLVRYLFERPVNSIDSLRTFREVFKEDDPLFPMVEGENDVELMCLIGSVLALRLLRDDGGAARLAMIIRTATFCDTRKPTNSVDLVGLADRAIARIGSCLRERPTLTVPTLVGKAAKSLAKTVPDVDPNDGESIKEALGALGRGVQSSLSEADSALKTYVALMDVFRKIQSEELEMLWWIVAGRCRVLNGSFDDLPPNAWPFVMGFEIADKVIFGVEPPSLAALLRKAGKTPKKPVDFSDYVDASVPLLRQTVGDSQPCASLQPCHFAIAKAIESGGAWSEAWAGATGLTPGSKLNPIDLAVQVCRERLILTP